MEPTFPHSDAPFRAPPQEGDLYQVIELHGRAFEIRYGYYEEIDRGDEPIPIYPDFKSSPVYTDEGKPFVTLMQDPCEHYEKKGKGSERDCGTCAYTERGGDLIGVCGCKKNERINE